MNSNKPKVIYLSHWLQHRSMGGITQKDIEASDELKRLHFKNQELETENVTLQAGYDAARLEIASLQAKLAAFDSASAVRRDQDAARYRWLSRKVGVYLTGVESEPVSLYLFCKNPVFEELVKETHKAIDTAIASINKG